MSTKMVDTCIDHQLLPPVLVLPTAQLQLNVVLFDYFTDTMVATGTISSWMSWSSSLVCSARHVRIDECLECEQFNPLDVARTADLMRTERMMMTADLPVHLNQLGVLHQYDQGDDPPVESMVRAGAHGRSDLLQHPQFRTSLQLLEADSVVKVFYEDHA